MIGSQSSALLGQEASTPLDNMPPPLLALMFLWSLSGYFALGVPLVLGDMEKVKRRIVPHALIGSALFSAYYICEWIGI